jgi:hypothetical protein
MSVLMDVVEQVLVPAAENLFYKIVKVIGSKENTMHFFPIMLGLILMTMGYMGFAGIWFIDDETRKLYHMKRALAGACLVGVLFGACIVIDTVVDLVKDEQEDCR